MPGGLVTREAFQRIAGEPVGRLSREMPVDAVYLDLDGAALSEDFEDAEGELLRRVGAAVGETVPIVMSLDHHGDVTPQMVQLTDGMGADRTYPQIDRPETGARSRGDVAHARRRPAPRPRLAKAPFLVMLNRQCTLVEPSQGIVEATHFPARDGILSCLTLRAFPPRTSSIAVPPSLPCLDRGARGSGGG